MLNPDKGIALFTDGSSWNVDRSGGWAWIALDGYNGEEQGAGSALQTTNNRMEMQAWIEGLTFIYRTCGSCQILVYSDSEYVGLGHTDPTRKRNHNSDLWKELTKVSSLHDTVKFVHVKGHADSYYNDLVDQMASKARKEKL